MTLKVKDSNVNVPSNRFKKNVRVVCLPSSHGQNVATRIKVQNEVLVNR